MERKFLLTTCPNYPVFPSPVVTFNSRFHLIYMYVYFQAIVKLDLGEILVLVPLLNDVKTRNTFEYT